MDCQRFWLHTVTQQYLQSEHRAAFGIRIRRTRDLVFSGPTSSYKVQERIGSWMADKEFFSQTIPFLEAQTEPFIAFLLSSSNHHPWELPDKYRVLKLGELEGTLLGNYLQSVRYFDAAFGEFIDR